MTTPIDRQRALPGIFRSAALVSVMIAMALVAACQESGSSVSTPAPMVPASGSPAVDPTGAPGATGAAAAAPVTPAPVPVEPPPAAPVAAPEPPPAAEPEPEPEPRPAREPKMEWREAPARASGDETLDTGGKHVFTNADLARYARPEDAAGSEAVAGERKAQEAFNKAADKKAQDQPATDAWRSKTKADAEQRVRDAEARLDALRRLSQSDANPLLPQPILSQEQQQKRQGLTAEQRYKMTQQEIQQAEQELAAAKADLARIVKNLAAAR